MVHFADDERAHLTAIRGITTNEHGEEVLVGLNVEETEFYMTYAREQRSSPCDSQRSERYQSLHNKYEMARLGVLAAENQLRVDKPTLN